MDLQALGTYEPRKACGARTRTRTVGTRLSAGGLALAGLIIGILAGSPNTVFVGLMSGLILELAPRCVAQREHRAAQFAVTNERRRLARELHDGLAQDLAFIALSGDRLATRGSNDRLLSALSVAAARALDETRTAIVGLDERADEQLAVAVERATGELADRFGLEIVVEGEGEALRAAPRRDVLRLLREAVNNAARHGGARRVNIALGDAGDRLLRVCDDGRGFQTDRPFRPGSRGMRGMEERARRLGGQLLTSSLPGGGTEVVVLMPPRQDVA